MYIRQATINDLEAMLTIYDHAREFMAKHGNPHQWGTNYPSKELLISDINNHHSYVCVSEDKIVGTFFYDYGESIEPTYQFIENGQWLDESAYGVVHRIATDGSKKGVGSYCLNWAYDQCHHLRIDTHDDNKVMQNLLIKLHFTYCGIIYLEDRSARRAYEKLD